MANKLGLSATHEFNLRKLAHGLWNQELIWHFDMGTFSDGKETFNRPHCGSVGCAIGSATLLVTPLKFSNYFLERWLDYSERVFGLSEGDDSWSFMFEGDWAKEDNSKKGAAARIIHALRYGIPKKFTKKFKFSNERLNFHKKLYSSTREWLKTHPIKVEVTKSKSKSKEKKNA